MPSSPRRVDTTDEWICERTGIREPAYRERTARRLPISRFTAAHAALDGREGMRVGEIDLIIVATTTPDETFPAVATTCRRGSA